MSLDVYLDIDPCGACGAAVRTAFTANYTHNVVPMAKVAGLYDSVWRPDEHGIERAEQLIAPLADGLTFMRAYPDRFRALNPENGWGSYDTFVPWLERYLAACKAYPQARVRVSR